MSGLFFGLFGSPSVRRRKSSGGLLSRVEGCESRVVLSANAVAKGVATAAVPANFAGTWTLTSQFGTGEAVITQEGAAVEASIDLGIPGGELEAGGKAVGDKLKLKAKGEFQGQPAKGKVRGTLTDATHFSGFAKVKLAGQKYILDFTAALQA